jgi:hypothetical protein
MCNCIIEKSFLLHEELADKKSGKKGGTRERGTFGCEGFKLRKGENHLQVIYKK